jgi:hypothetical protein
MNPTVFEPVDKLRRFEPSPMRWCLPRSTARNEAEYGCGRDKLFRR